MNRLNVTRTIKFSFAFDFNSETTSHSKSCINLTSMSKETAELEAGQLDMQGISMGFTRITLTHAATRMCTCFHEVSKNNCNTHTALKIAIF